MPRSVRCFELHNGVLYPQAPSFAGQPLERAAKPFPNPLGPCGKNRARTAYIQGEAAVLESVYCASLAILRQTSLCAGEYLHCRDSLNRRQTRVTRHEDRKSVV